MYLARIRQAAITRTRRIFLSEASSNARIRVCVAECYFAHGARINSLAQAASSSPQADLACIKVEDDTDDSTLVMLAPKPERIGKSEHAGVFGKDLSP